MSAIGWLKNDRFPLLTELNSSWFQKLQNRGKTLYFKFYSFLFASAGAVGSLKLEKMPKIQKKIAALKVIYF